LKPLTYLRPFDVMAEWQLQEKMSELARTGPIDDLAKGVAKQFGLAMAIYIASRKFGKPRPAVIRKGARAEASRETAQICKAEDFDRQIVNRMGREFYERVFAPRILMLRALGKSYNEIKIDLGRDFLAEGVPLYSSWLRFLGRG